MNAPESDPLDRVALRIEAFQDGKSEAVTDPGAIADAHDLARNPADANGPAAAEVAYTLGWLHWCRFLAGDHDDDLRAAVALFALLDEADRGAVPATVRRHLPRVGERGGVRRRAIVAGDLMEYAARSRSLPLLDRAIDQLVTVSRTPRVRASTRGAAQYDVGVAYEIRHALTGRAADLESAIAAYRSALTVATVSTTPGRPAALLNLALALYARATTSEAPEHLDESITTGREALAAVSSGDPAHAELLSLAWSALRRRFDRAGAPADLDEAIAALQELIGVAEAERGYPARLSNLGALRRRRFELHGSDLDLDESIRLHRRAAQATPADDARLAPVLSNLSASLRSRHERTGAMPDLASAIDAARKAVRVSRPDDLDRAGYLINLALALHSRFQLTDTGPDLEEAIDAGRAAAQADHPRRHAFLADLAILLIERFDCTGNRVDLDEAVDLSRRSADIAGPGHHDLPRLLSVLGSALRCRFEALGALADIDETIRIELQAVSDIPSNDPYRLKRLSNLVAALVTKFNHTGTPTGVNDAIVALRQALREVPAADPALPVVLSNLALVLSRTDPDEAVDVARAAVSAASAGPLGEASCRSSLSVALAARSEQTGSASDLDEAVATAIEAVRGLPEPHPAWAGFQVNLGLFRHTRYRRRGDGTDLRRAVDAWSAAFGASTARVDVRLAAADHLSDALDAGTAVDVYTTAVSSLLPMLAWHGIDRTDRQRLLRRHAASLGRDSAACAIAAGRTGLEVELLELGRAVLWSQLLGLRTDLTALTAAAPNLAERLRRCRTVLDTAPGPTDRGEPLVR